MRELSHGSNKTVTSPRNRFNESWILTQCLSQQKDVVGEATLFDERVGPKHADQFVLLQHASTISDQQMQGVECFGRERYYLVAAQQLAFGGIQTEGAKFVKTQSFLARRPFSHRERIAETCRGGSGAFFLAQSASLDPRENSLRSL